MAVLTTDLRFFSLNILLILISIAVSYSKTIRIRIFWLYRTRKDSSHKLSPVVTPQDNAGLAFCIFTTRSSNRRFSRVSLQYFTCIITEIQVSNEVLQEIRISGDRLPNIE